MRVRPASTDACSKHAKTLKRALAGVDIPITLSAAQNLVGRMHGYRTWHEMVLAARTPGLPSPHDEDVDAIDRSLRRRHQASVLSEACGLPRDLAESLADAVAPTARKAGGRPTRILPVGKVGKDADDGLDDLRSRLTSALALLPTVDARTLGGGGGKPLSFDEFDIMMATGLGEDEIGTARPLAWPIRDAEEVSALASALRMTREEADFDRHRLRTVDPGDATQVLFAIGLRQGEPIGYLHAERKVSLGGSGSSPDVGYWFDLKTIYLSPPYRGLKISYAFSVLVKRIVENELYEIAEKAPSVLSHLGLKVFFSTEIEQIPDNKLMRRMDIMFQTIENELEVNFPDGEFRFVFDYDNVPMILANLL